MSGRLTNMKYIAVIAVAVVSLLSAIPLSQQQPKQHLVSDITVVKPEAKPKVSAPPVVTKPAAQPTATPTPSVATPPQPTVTLASYRCQAWASDFEQYNWNADTAMAICEAESSGNSQAVSNGNINPDGIPDYGLMQLHGVDILDPAANISYAYYHKYLTQGWGAWSTYNSGAYYKYL